MKQKKGFAVVGVIASVALVLGGIVVMTGFFGSWYSRGVGSPTGSYGTTYDYGYAVFGADFYNYVSNNAGMAGYGAQAAANNTADILDMLKFAVGIVMICFGAGGFAAFGIVLSGCGGKKAVSPGVGAPAPSPEMPAPANGAPVAEPDEPEKRGADAAYAYPYQTDLTPDRTPDRFEGGKPE